MLTDISNYTLYELASIRGEMVSLCRYQYYNSEFNEGYVIYSESFYFFVRVRTQIIEDRHEVHFLVVKDFHNCEINDAFKFTPIFTGMLKDIILFKSKRKLELSSRQPEVITETSLLLEFDQDEKFLIYPKTGLFSNTSFLRGTDSILETIWSEKLRQSRLIKKDEKLLKSLERCESLHVL
jgi:hypothetical protein